MGTSVDPAVVTDGKDAEKIEWRSLNQPGSWVKPLGRSPVTGAVGGLFKMEPWSEAAAHSHPSPEFALILEGEVELDGKMYGPGTFFHRPIGVVHGPHKTREKGVIMFACFAGPSGSEDTLKLVPDK